jgi:glycosyltransferase involved in cell wall biosynthesis
MRLSLYTSVKDGLFYDYHVVEMLEHHLPLADEIIVHDGNSTDGTFEKVSRIDPKIKVIRSDWGKPTGLEWIAGFKNVARKQCSGDWCINIDCDEFIPEWEFDDLRTFLSGTDEVIVPLRIINYYGNYRVYHSRPEKVPWPDVKWNIHRNLPDVEVIGDGSNVRLPGHERRGEARFSCHHFGFVRHAARLRQKWRNILGNLYRKRNNQRQRWFSLPSFLFDWWPHDWKDPHFLPDLAIYDGPYIRAVRDNPDEFVRDGFALYRHLQLAQRSP